MWYLTCSEVASCHIISSQETTTLTTYPFPSSFPMNQGAEWITQKEIEPEILQPSAYVRWMLGSSCSAVTSPHNFHKDNHRRFHPGSGCISSCSCSSSSCFCDPSILKRQLSHRQELRQAELERYDAASVEAVRSGDISKLRRMLSNGKSFQARNRSGETLLHLACRRSSRETVEFLLREAQVDPLCAIDDMGRTILHDLCWRASPHLDIMDLVWRHDRDKFRKLVLWPDTRGHVCLDYCRREHWKVWIDYLRANRQHLSPDVGTETAVSTEGRLGTIEEKGTVSASTEAKATVGAIAIDKAIAFVG